MNLLGLMKYDYKIECVCAPEATGYQVTLYDKAHNDMDFYRTLTKLELETLRDNAKRLYEACNNALPEDERT